MNKPIFKSSNAQGEGLLGGVPRGDVEGLNWSTNYFEQIFTNWRFELKQKKLERSKESQAIKTVAQQVLVFQGR